MNTTFHNQKIKEAKELQKTWKVQEVVVVYEGTGRVWGRSGATVRLKAGRGK